MSSWIERLSNATLVVITWVGRVYGVFFLALGLLFLYWSTRGLLAYRAGVREAWSDPVASAAGLVAALLALWAGFHVVRHGIPSASHHPPSELDSLIDQAIKLEKTDPAAARDLMDGYFMREAAATDARRADLRHRAPTDLNAALALKQELLEEIASNDDLRKNLLAHPSQEGSSSMLADMSSANRDLEAELLRLNETIERLKLQ
jgi:hypothetical protein